MATNYTIKQGDHVSKLAKQFGFADFATIWDDPNNAALKQLRKNPNVLNPGDQLFIPDKQLKKVGRQTGATHRFKARVVPLMLRVVVKNVDDTPLANTSCKLQVAGKTFPLTTDKNGKIEQEIPRDSETAQLVVLDQNIPIRIGHLDPVDQVSGYRARLNNLGYHAGSSDDPDDAQLRSAIEEFQCDQHLKVDGKCGPQTQKQLEKVHGC
jgi:hypothetical protein